MSFISETNIVLAQQVHLVLSLFPHSLPIHLSTSEFSFVFCCLTSRILGCQMSSVFRSSVLLNTGTSSCGGKKWVDERLQNKNTITLNYNSSLSFGELGCKPSNPIRRNWKTYRCKAKNISWTTYSFQRKPKQCGTLHKKFATVSNFILKG